MFNAWFPFTNSLANQGFISLSRDFSAYDPDNMRHYSIEHEQLVRVLKSREAQAKHS